MIWDWAVEIIARLPGVSGSFGAGWYWLGADTFGNRGEYVIPMLVFVGLAFYIIISGGWGVFTIRWLAKEILFPALIWILVWSGKFLKAILICLWAAAVFLSHRIKATAKRVRSPFP